MNTTEKITEIGTYLDERDITNTIEYNEEENAWEMFIVPDVSEASLVSLIFERWNMKDCLQYDYDEDELEYQMSAYIFDKDYDD